MDDRDRAVDPSGTAGQPDPDRHHVHVEVHALSLVAGALHVRTIMGHLIEAATPDETAARLAGASASCLVHSTSWRHGDHGVVLTYVVVPDPSPQDGATRRVDRGLTTTWSLDPRSPGAVEPPTDAVVAHACRHLAFLEHRDPDVADLASRHSRLFTAVRDHGTGLAGQFTPSLSEVG